MAFMYSAWPRTKGICSRAQRSASQVPGEDALDADDQVLPVGCDRAEEGPRVTADVLIEEDLAGLVEDAEIHGAGVQVNPTVVFVLAGVGSHRFPSCDWVSQSILAYPMWGRHRKGH
jgi:hypothetical protein